MFYSADDGISTAPRDGAVLHFDTILFPELSGGMDLGLMRSGRHIDKTMTADSQVNRSMNDTS